MATATINRAAWASTFSPTSRVSHSVPLPSYDDAIRDDGDPGGPTSVIAVNAPEPVKLSAESLSGAGSGRRPANPLPSIISTSTPAVAAAPRTTHSSLFPTSFNYYSGYSSLSTFWIGEHRETPLYAYRLHSGLSGLPPVVLHSSPEVLDDNMWADIDWGMFQNDFRIGLPDLPEKGERVTEMLQRDHGRQLTSVFRFSIEVGGAGSRLREQYEWRRSSGDVMDSLAGGGGGSGSGYKLMRLAEGAPPGADPAGYTKTMGEFTSSDGFEVVAAWSGVSGSLTKHARFSFLGTGASGMLGERWALMAVVTSLALWEKERRAKKHRNGAIGALGGVVTAVI